MTSFRRTQLTLSMLNALLVVGALIPFGLDWRSAIVLLIAGAVTMVLLVMGSSMLGPSLDPPPQRRRQHYLLVFAAPWLLTAVVVLAGSLSTIDRCRITTCQPAAWATQRRTALRAAERYGFVFVPADVHAKPRFNNGTYDYTVLETTFGFVAPGGDQFMVQFEDSHPWLTVEVSDLWQSNTGPSSDFVDALNKVQISPSQALHATLTEGRTFLAEGEMQYAPDIWLYAPTKVLPATNASVAWTVGYARTRGDRLENFYLTVDAQTGEVVHRNLRP